MLHGDPRSMSHAASTPTIAALATARYSILNGLKMNTLLVVQSVLVSRCLVELRGCVQGIMVLAIKGRASSAFERIVDQFSGEKRQGGVVRIA